jgi:predicted RecA/RadA family phage recombinase
MKNFVQPGQVVTLTAPYDVASGGGLKVGGIVGVATFAAKAGEKVETKLDGVFDVAKTSAQAWTAGAAIYWDDTAKLFTSVVGTNTKVGVALLDAANPSDIGRVRLNGSF